MGLRRVNLCSEIYYTAKNTVNIIMTESETGYILTGSSYGSIKSSIFAVSEAHVASSSECRFPLRPGLFWSVLNIRSNLGYSVLSISTQKALNQTHIGDYHQ